MQFTIVIMRVHGFVQGIIAHVINVIHSKREKILVRMFLEIVLDIFHRDALHLFVAHAGPPIAGAVATRHPTFAVDEWIKFGMHFGVFRRRENREHLVLEIAPWHFFA